MSDSYVSESSHLITSTSVAEVNHSLGIAVLLGRNTMTSTLLNLPLCDHASKGKKHLWAVK